MDNPFVVLALILSIIIACILISFGIVRRSKKERKKFKKIVQELKISRYTDDIILLWPKYKWKPYIAGTIIFCLIGSVMIYYNSTTPLVANLIWIVPLTYYALGVVFEWPKLNKMFFLADNEKVEVFYIYEGKPPLEIKWGNIENIFTSAGGYGGIDGLAIETNSSDYIIFDTIPNFPQFCRLILDVYNHDKLNEKTLEYLEKKRKMIKYSPMEWP